MVSGAGIKEDIEKSKSVILRSEHSAENSPGGKWRGSFGPTGSVHRLREGSVSSKKNLLAIEDLDDEDYILIDQELTRFADDLDLKDDLIERVKLIFG